MSVVGLLAGIGAFFKVRYVQDKAIIDNHIFRLHYRFTSAFFFAACVLTTAFNLFGNPIDCMTGVPFSRPDVINTYCWLQSTFTLAREKNQRVGTEFAHPGVGPEKSDSDHRYHTYYQWVPFVLFLQGVLFYLPHWIWKMNEDGRIRDMTNDSRGTDIGHGSARQEHCSALFRYLVQTMRYHRNLINAYVVCEILNFANVVGNIYFVNRFLNGAFFTYGTRVVQLSNEDQEDRDDPMVEIFPRMTKCNFHMYGSSGTIQKIDALCLLPLNIANEKIYIFLWFWLIILAVVSGLALIYRLAVFLSPAFRLFLIRRLASPSKASAETVVWRVSIGDYFLLHTLGKNLEGFLFNRLMDDLATHLTSNPNEPDEHRSSWFRRQTSKLSSELMSSVEKRASFRSKPLAKAIYLPMEEPSVTKAQIID